MRLNTPLWRLGLGLWIVFCTRSSAFQQWATSRCFVLVRPNSGVPSRHISSERSTLHMAQKQGGPEKRRKSPLDRVLSPKIDDPALPLTDTFVAQIIGPSLQVFWLTFAGSPAPTWLKPIFDNALWQYRGALLAPTLIHGAGLACCWLLGALMARAYEEEAIDPTIGGYATVLWRIFQAGCFSTGVLIFATQIDLLMEFGRYIQPGESVETDARILAAWVDVLNDVFFRVLSSCACAFVPCCIDCRQQGVRMYAKSS
jgi:hypothetical protein